MVYRGMVISMAVYGEWTGTKTIGGVSSPVGSGLKIVMIQQPIEPVLVKTTKTSSGWRPPTNRVAQTWDRRMGTFFCDLAYTKGRIDNRVTASGWNTSDFPYTWDVVPIVPTREIDLMVNRLIGKISDNQAGMGENLATRQQLADLMADNVNRIHDVTKESVRVHSKGWKSLRRSRFWKHYGWHKVPDFFLEYVYAIQPLMSDTKGAFDLMKKIDADGIPDRIHFKTGTKGKDVQDTPYYGNLVVSPFSIYTSYHIETEWKAFIRVDYAADNPALRALQQLGVVNPVELAWNLIPYSFVVDWFIPIGNYLQGWTADLGLRFIGGSITTVIERHVQLTGYHATPGLTSETVTVSPGLWHYKKYVRNVLRDTPAPRMPTWKNPFSALHFAEAMSLLVGVFR